MADAVAFVAVFVHPVRVPLEERFLLVPSQGALRRVSRLEYGISFMFETDEHLPWQRVGLSEGDEVGPALPLQVGKNAAEVETTDQWVRRHL
jgi:hypothetical protein